MKLALFLKDSRIRWVFLLVMLVIAVSLVYPRLGWGTGAVIDYTGRAFFPPAEIGIPDTSAVLFPQGLPDTDYTVVLGGVNAHTSRWAGGVRHLLGCECGLDFGYR